MNSVEENCIETRRLVLEFDMPFELAPKDPNYFQSGELSDPNEQEALEAPRDTSFFQDKRIILAEDSRTCQMLMIAMLGADEPDITIANNGIEAIELCSQEPYDLVLMDYHMPIMGGIEATRLIRQQEVEQGRKAAVIVAVTADIQADIQEECLAVGMNDFLTKPYKRKQLFDILEKWLQ